MSSETSPRPLIQEIPAQRGASAGHLAGIASAVVYLGQDGTLSLTPPRATLWERLFPTHTARLEVDRSRRLDLVTLTLPSCLDAYDFRAAFSVVWQVEEPLSVARLHIADGLPFIRAHLLNVLARMSRKWDIEDYAGFEREINEMFGDTGDPAARRLEEGLMIHRLAARVQLDEGGRSWLAQQRNARRTIELLPLSLNVEQLRQYNEAELARIKQQHELELEKARQLAAFELQQQRYDEYATALLNNTLAAYDMAQHPEGVGKYVRDRQAEEQNDKTRLELFERMLKEGVITDADLDDFRRTLIDSAMNALSRPAAAGPFPPVGADSKVDATPDLSA